MLPKRLTMLMLSALLALSTVAFTAPLATANSGHPNIIVQSVINMEDIDAAGSYWTKANLSREMLKDIRHWVDEHTTPPFVTRLACVPEYNTWLLETRSLARVGFRYYRGKATAFKEYPTDERAQVRVTQMLIFDRIEGRQVDAQKAFLNCIFDNMPLRLRLLLF